MIYLVLLLVFVIAFLLVLKFGVLTDKDNDFIPDELEVLAEDITEDIMERAENVKEELKDVKNSAKNLAKQAGDVVEAASGKKRRGRKPKKK